MKWVEVSTNLWSKLQLAPTRSSRRGRVRREQPRGFATAPCSRRGARNYRNKKRKTAHWVSRIERARRTGIDTPRDGGPAMKSE